MNMKKLALVVMCSALAACNNDNAGKTDAGAAQNETKAESTTTAGAFKSEDEKASYAIGLRYGEGFARDLKELDMAAFSKGVEDGFKGTPQLKSEEIIEALQALQARKMEEKQQEFTQKSEANKQSSEEFMTKNKARPEVKTTASGLQYEVLKQGEGATPTESDEVRVHYHGTLPDGTVFDSSVDRGEPINFAVTGVIKGWTEALQMMKVGDKWKIYVPADLAYADRGAGPKIGPNQALIFEVELLGIEGKEAAPEAGAQAK